MITIVDSGGANMASILFALARLHIRATVSVDANKISDSSHVILPGVGSADKIMQRLVSLQLNDVIRSLTQPVLGICVGMQMLADGSDEGSLPGLGWVPGRVKSLASNPVMANLPMPHMGWNTLKTKPESRLFQSGFDDEPQFYFLHSYYFDAADKNDVVASAYYGVDFDVVVSRGHIHGVQCHPEKSHHWGAQLLKNFAEFG